MSDVSLSEIVTYLDGYLRIAEVPDDPNAVNGLQVENSGRVARLVAAVDASQATIDGLGRDGSATAPTLLIVHHGLFWDGQRSVTGRRYRRLGAVLRQDAAVYSAHIPLDLHPVVGNNAVLADRLGLTSTEPFGEHQGVLIGRVGTAPSEVHTLDALAKRLAAVLQIQPQVVKVIGGGPARPSRIGVITGGAGSAIAEARAAGCDTFITGEGAAHTYFDAMEEGVNVLYAGHYATETVGVQALAAHAAGRFGLPWSFHDHPTGL